MGFLKSLGGFLGSVPGVGRIFGSQGANDARNTLQYGAYTGMQGLSSAKKQAMNFLDKGAAAAGKQYETGFEGAKEATTQGYDKAADQYAQAGEEAKNTAAQGFGQAKGYYETQPMVASRQELYNRVLGQGGLSPEALAKQKAGAIEDYGTAMKAAEQGLHRMYGGSTASGLTGEQLARAEAGIGAERANTLRNIDIQNEQLKRQEQTGAIGTLESEAAQRAGLSQNEAQYMSGLAERLGRGAASLTQDETAMLTQIAAQRGQTLGQLQYNLATGKAAITTDEAKALAELANNAAVGIAGIQAQPSFGQQLAQGAITQVTSNLLNKALG